MASGRLSKVKGKVVDIPTVPTIGTATAGAESASVAFTASTKGGPVSTYTALSNPGSVTGSGTSSPVTLSGLTAGTAYTFTVRGNNVTGSSEYSSASNSVTPTVANSYESIQTVTVGSGGAASISFTSIPSTYKHLQIRGIGRTSRTATQDEYKINFNSDTGSNYARHGIVGYGSGSEVASSLSSQTHWRAGWLAGNTLTSNFFGAAVFDILDYANTSKYKTGRGITNYDGNGNGNAGFVSGLWISTSAITQIDITPAFNSFTQYSSFALYGIKG